MKKTTKLCALVLLVCLCLCAFTACIKTEDAKALASDFFAAVSAQDFEAASALLHPDRPADLARFFADLGEAEDIDFSQGIEIKKYVGFASSFYDTEVAGSSYKLTMRTAVGDKEITFAILIADNEGGYGIYDIEYAV